jgi:peptidoglycan hydrolase-like protein with peptidoglycan-binding domain
MKNKTIAVFMTLVLGVFMLPAFTHAADALYRQLELGVSGADVTALQTFLASDSTLYPQGIISGYFGSLTKSAVMRFQTRNGISPVGRVGPITLAALNLQMAGGVSNNGTAPIISAVNVNANRNSAVVTWNTVDASRGVVYYSTTPLTTYERTNSVDVSGITAMTDNNLRNSQNVSLQNLQQNTTYYYLVYTTNAAGNVSVTWPSTFHTSN